MRGLPSCGKSWTAKRIAAEEGGAVIEFDKFFEQSEKGGSPGKKFNWNRAQLPAARRWHFSRVSAAIDMGVSPVVIDDDHRPGSSAKTIAAYAMLHGYKVEFAEPESPWWKTIKPLLEDKEANGEGLAEWAQKLCILSKATHNVPLRNFVSRMEAWQPSLTLLDLLVWGEEPTDGDAIAQEVAA